MTDNGTVDHHVKKKKKKSGDVFLDNSSCLENSESDGHTKKKKNKIKKKHRRTDDDDDDETLMEVTLSPSNSFIKDVDGIEQEMSIQESYDNTRKSPKSKKKKCRSMSLEETLQEEDQTGQPNMYDGNDHEDEVAASEETLNISVRKKKKKKQRPSESLEEDVSEDIKPILLSTVLNENTDLDSSKRKKHRLCIENPEEDALEDINRTAPLIMLNENTDLENSVRKKKKRHQHTQILKEDNFSDDNQSNKLNSPRKSNTQKSRQMEKDRNVSSTPSKKTTEDSDTEFSKGTPSSKFELRTPSKTKKNVSVQETSSKLAIEAKSTFNDESEPTVGCLSPKIRRSQTVTVTEDVSFSEHTDLEHSKQKKRKRKLTENCSERESSICSKSLRINKSPIPIRDDCTMSDSFIEERENNLDALENTTEETNIDVRTQSKTKKSVKSRKSKRIQDHDVTAELEQSDQDETKNTPDMETSKPKKKSRSKTTKSTVSSKNVLQYLHAKDVALLEEYFPKIRSWNERTVSDVIGHELKRIKEAKAKGIKFVTGRFDSTEDEVIKKNVEEFSKLVGLSSAEMLFHSYRFPETKSTIEKLKKQYNFRQRICQGIAHTSIEVYNRGAKLYDLSGTKGRFSKEETENLQKAVKIYGHHWTAIGKLIGRSSKTAQLKASQLRREVTGGKWGIDEVDRLVQALKQITLKKLNTKKGKRGSKTEPLTVPKVMLFTEIPWAKVEEKVQTRNWAHCKSKWNDILLLRMNDGISPCEGVFGIQTNIELIKWLHEAEIPKGQVDWIEMSKAVGNIPPGILQQKVYKLKTRFLPDWRSMGFQEIVDSLYMEVLPMLESKVKDPPSSQNRNDMPEKKDEFIFSDIFREYTGDDKYCLTP